MPQLIRFIFTNQLDIAEALINKGASVNVTSSDGWTPLMATLQKLCESDGTTTLFNLIIKQNHTLEIMNSKSEKKIQTALFISIDTGTPAIVENILKMRADPNLVASLDHQTALNYCLAKINNIKNPQKAINQILEPLRTGNLTDYHINEIKRQPFGSKSFLNEDIQSNWQHRREDPLYREILSIVAEINIENEIETKDIANYRKIAMLLIDHKANVNFEHMQPIIGYTPFMLAAAFDEVELFQYMHKKGGGDLTKTYRDYRTNNDIDIKEIATYFKSNGILDYLKTIR